MPCLRPLSTLVFCCVPVGVGKGYPRPCLYVRHLTNEPLSMSISMCCVPMCFPVLPDVFFVPSPRILYIHTEKKTAREACPGREGDAPRRGRGEEEERVRGRSKGAWPHPNVIRSRIRRRCCFEMHTRTRNVRPGKRQPLCC